jgi:hypothetical protein
MQLHKRVTILSEGALFEAIITAAVGTAPMRGWFTLPTVVKRDGQPVTGVVWTCHAADPSQGFLHTLHAPAPDGRVFDQLTEALRAVRPRLSVQAEVRAVV